MNTLIIILQAMLAIMFLASGGSKLAGTQMHVDHFKHLYHYPDWFRVVTGAAETLGGIGIVVGIWMPGISGLAGLFLAVIMLGALYTEAFRVGGWKAIVQPILPLTLSVIVTVIQWSETMQLLGLG